MKIKISIFLIFFSLIFSYRLKSSNQFRNIDPKGDHITKNIQLLLADQKVKDLPYFVATAEDLKVTEWSNKKRKFSYSNRNYYYGDYIVSDEFDNIKNIQGNQRIKVYTYFNVVFGIEPHNDEYVVSAKNSARDILSSLKFDWEPLMNPRTGLPVSNSSYDVIKIRLNGQKRCPPGTKWNGIDCVKDTSGPTNKIPYIAGAVGGTVWTIYSTVMLSKYNGKIRGSTSSGEVEFYQDYSDSYQFQIPMAMIITAGSAIGYFWDSFSFIRSR